MIKKETMLLLLTVLTVSLTGCAKNETANSASSAPESEATSGGSSDSGSSDTQTESVPSELPDLTVRFGYDGEAFTLHLLDNETALTIARYVGKEEWNLPINHYDDYEGWEYMQYYDIPSRYEIPSDPVSVTSAKDGEEYYSAPNRVILFYQDAEITGDYTKVGDIENSKEFVDAVTNNPVLEGWDTKIVIIERSQE